MSRLSCDRNSDSSSASSPHIGGVKRAPDAIDNEVKKQRVASAAMGAEMDTLLAQFSSAREALQSGASTPSETLSTLREHTTRTQQTTLSLARSKTQSLQDTSEVISSTLCTPEMYHEVDADGTLWASRDEPVIDLIGRYLYASGCAETAAIFEAESGTSIDPEVKAAHEPLFALLKYVDSRNTTELLAAAESMRDDWASDRPYPGPGFVRKENQLDTLRFLLHQLEVSRLINESNRDAAQCYIRDHLSSFIDTDKWSVVLKMMGRLMFIGADKVPSRYREVDVEETWRKVRVEVVEVWCALKGEPRHPHLMVALAAGYEVMPVLLKYMALPALFRKTRELHVPALPRGMLFHSSISCPVTQQVTTDGDGANPAMMLPCCHVISKAAVATLSRSNQTLKCPYCPRENTQTECKPLFL